jgi:hypothetical protein
VCDEALDHKQKPVKAAALGQVPVGSGGSDKSAAAEEQRGGSTAGRHRRALCWQGCAREREGKRSRCRRQQSWAAPKQCGYKALIKAAAYRHVWQGVVAIRVLRATGPLRSC